MNLFHRVFGERSYWHWQNLDEDRQGCAKGRGWRHGRAWFNFRVDREEGKDRNSIGIGVEWVLDRLRPSRPLSVKLALGGGDGNDELDGHLSIFGNALYVSLDSPVARALTKRFTPERWDREREIRFAVHGETLWWTVWQNPHEWKSSDPKWRSGSFDVPDFVLGRNDYKKVVLEERDVLIPMPEKTYPGRATLELCTWTRRRLGWPARRVVRANIEVEGGIPHPGKGENAWDCGDDATYSITTPADTIEEGVSKFVHSVLSRRTRYGGAQWQPVETSAA